MTNLIKTIFLDVLSLFKNFFHWNISKMVISFVRYLLGFIFALPFILLLLIVIFTLLDWNFLVNTIIGANIGANFWSYIVANIYSVILSLIIIIFAVIGLVIGYFYGGVLLFNYNLNLLKGNKLAFWDKSYLDFKSIVKYTKILLWISLFIIIPIIIFLVLVVAFGSIAGVSESVELGEKSLFSIISFIGIIILFVTIFYLLYRLSFSYIILLDKENYPEEKDAKFYIKESLRLTSSPYTILKLLIILILFSLIITPFSLLGKTIDDKYNSMRTYFAYEKYSIEGVELSEKEIYIYNTLKLEYSNTNKKDLLKTISNYSLYQTLFYIFNYLFIYGIFEMVFVSFYINELRAKSIKKPSGLLKRFLLKGKQKD